jgi:nucleoid-associated protein YgaU
MKITTTMKSGYQYTVQIGDSLYSIAKHKYGNGKFWPLIYHYKDNKKVIGLVPNQLEAFRKIELW